MKKRQRRSLPKKNETYPKKSLHGMGLSSKGSQKNCQAAAGAEADPGAASLAGPEGKAHRNTPLTRNTQVFLYNTAK